MNDLDAFFLRQEEPTKSCLQALRSIILQFDDAITEAWKYRLPFYLYRGKTFCYLWMGKQNKHPYIGIIDGRLIDHPALYQGDRKRIKIFPIHPEEDIPVEAIYEVLSLARELRIKK